MLQTFKLDYCTHFMLLYLFYVKSIRVSFISKRDHFKIIANGWIYIKFHLPYYLCAHTLQVMTEAPKSHDISF